jgi:hypothetical protein
MSAKLESMNNEGIACVCHGYGFSYCGTNKAGWEVWSCPECKSWQVYGIPAEIREELR